MRTESSHSAELHVCRLEADEHAFRVDVLVARAAADEHGVLSLAELGGCGLSRDAIAGRARRGWLHRRHRGVYAVGHPNLTLAGQFLAAVKACGPRAALSHYAGAAHWGYVEWDGRCPEVTAPIGGARHCPGIRIHHSGFLEARDFRRRDGIRVTAPARTLVDVASVLSYQALRSAVARALSFQHLSVGDLVEALDRLGPRRGAAKMRRILASGPAPTRSVLEDAVLRLIDEARLPRPEVNVAMRVEGRRVIPDFRWPDRRLIVEADGAIWHDNRAAREADAERQALLEAHGEMVLRVTWTQVMRSRGQTIARLRAAHAAESRITRAEPE
jgi:very-short-patch-repair endonuclease/predicted transcriptional regulator of viral defense system